MGQSIDTISDTVAGNITITKKIVNPTYKSKITQQYIDSIAKKKKIAQAIIDQANANYVEPVREVEVDNTGPSEFRLLNVLLKKLNNIKRPEIISHKGTWKYLNSLSELIIWFFLSRGLPILIVLGVFYKIFEFLKLGERLSKANKIYKDSMKSASVILEERNNNYTKIDKWFKGIYLFIIQIFKELFVL